MEKVRLDRTVENEGRGLMLMKNSKKNRRRNLKMVGGDC
jgi:hypothetical protein